MLQSMVGGFDRAATFLACALIGTLLGCVALGVVTRTLGAPLIWTDELSRFLMVWIAVFGWVLASRKRLHVRIRYFQDLFPARAHRAIEFAIHIALTLFGVLVTWYSVGLVAKNHDLEATTLPISMSWMYVPMVLAGIVTAIQGAAEVRESLRRIHDEGTAAAEDDGAAPR